MAFAAARLSEPDPDATLRSIFALANMLPLALAIFGEFYDTLTYDDP